MIKLEASLDATTMQQHNLLLLLCVTQSSNIVSDSGISIYIPTVQLYIQFYILQVCMHCPSLGHGSS